MTIIDNHHISARNVVSKYYRFLPEQIDMAIDDFVSILKEHDYHPTGQLFFSIISDPTAEEMMVELFMPIEEDNFHIESGEQCFYNSYFTIGPMIMTRIVHDFNNESQVVFWELIQYLEEQRLEQVTPVFVEYKLNNEGEAYVEMSVGAAQEIA